MLEQKGTERFHVWSVLTQRNLQLQCTRSHHSSSLHLMTSAYVAFAYGTLPGHIEKGEECFWIEKDNEGIITYHIKAFSKPAYLFIWLVYPIARFFQRRFVKQSMDRMKKLSNEP